LSPTEIQLLSLDSVKVQKYNVRKKEIDKGIEDLAASIKAVGLLQPITVFFDSEKEFYVILAGQRRLNAHHNLNDKYPGKGWDKIKSIVIDEPETNEKKMALSLAENITQAQMANSDIVKAVTDLFNTYRDYEMVQEEFGLTRYMIDKFVRLARLPERLKEAINEGEISPQTRVAENSALRAVDALKWTKGGEVSVEDVLEMAQEYAKGEIDAASLDSASTKGGSVGEIKESARAKPKTKLQLSLDNEMASKLKKVADNSGDTESAKAVSYISAGVQRDFDDLEE
jgi:ParB family transcriptional regulator, chromosome partitioning protein